MFVIFIHVEVVERVHFVYKAFLGLATSLFENKHSVVLYENVYVDY